MSPSSLESGFRPRSSNETSRSYSVKAAGRALYQLPLAVVRGPLASPSVQGRGSIPWSHRGFGVVWFPPHISSRLGLGTDTGCRALGQAEIQTR